jgi:hypothetical protein
MKTSVFIYVLSCFLVNLSSAWAASLKGTDDIVSAEKIRAGYMGIYNIDVLPKMADAGMNLALVKFGELHTPMWAGEQELLMKWAKACQQAGVRFMPVINLWGMREKKWIRLRYHLYYDGIEFAKTPCPLEAKVYKLAVHDRVLELAKLSRSVPIAGAAIDLEMYGADVWNFPDYCLCDYCFERFLAGKPVSKPIVADKRQDYLVKSKQVKSYRIFTTNYIKALAKQKKEQLETIAPDFMIGALHLDRLQPYYTGLAKGLGNGRKAVLAFTETTYRTGHSSYIHKTQKRFHDSGVNAKLVVGIWQDKFPPENLAEQYYHCARDSAGYWIYTMESLSKHTKVTLPFDKKQYWQAIQEANGELDKLAANPKYKSLLKVRSFKTPVKAISFKKIAVEPVEYVRSWAIMDRNVKPITLRFFNKLIFVAKKGDKLEFEIAFGKKQGSSTSHVEVGLVSRSGDVLARDKASLLSNAKLKVEAPYSGSYVIAVQSHGNSAKVVGFSHPYSIDASITAHFLKPSGSLYLYKPAGSSSAKVMFYVDGIGESVTATFKNEAGKVLGVYDIVGKQTIAVPLAKSREDEIIELNIQPRAGTWFEDVWIRIESGVEKYISSFRQAVVRGSLP